MIKNKKAFTLVELIVVITILAILGTIAFISLQGYSKDARDSTRISDLSAMKTSLELFQLDAGKYPEPTDGFIVTYSGSEVWTQGTFGITTFSNISKLDKIPKDPLTDKEYTYSVTKTKQEYQFAGIVEGDEITLNSAISQTNAGDLIATALVTGTYNGQIIKTENGTNCNILSLPSIISSEPNTTTDLITILNNKSLVFNGYNNLPTNYISSKYKTDGGFDFESNQLIVYDDSLSCEPLYNPEDNTARVELITNLQEAYSGTLIENNDGISGIVNLDITDTDKLDIISATLVNNDLGGNIAISGVGGDETSIEINEPTIYTIADCTGETQLLTGSTIYSGCDTADIIVCSGIGTGYILSACNVGSSIAGLTLLSYGNYFQWGRDKGFSPTDTSQQPTQIPNASYDKNNDIYGFVWNSNLSSYRSDWIETQDDNLWGDTTNTSIARQGPCATGYHIPSKSEWIAIIAAGGWGTNGTNMMNDLKMPVAGVRAWEDSNNYGSETNGFYWSSSTTNIFGSSVYIFSITGYYSSSGIFIDYYNRAGGYSIRCLKN